MRQWIGRFVLFSRAAGQYAVIDGRNSSEPLVPAENQKLSAPAYSPGFTTYATFSKWKQS